MIIKTSKCDLIFNSCLIDILDDYKHKVNKNKIGSNLKKRLGNKHICRLENIDLLFEILHTKKPQIYAESQVKGNGDDWNREELKILGSVCAAYDVLIYDDGRHTNPKTYNSPLKIKYIFVPGALLRNGYNKKNAPDRDLVYKNKIIETKYNSYYLNKLNPVFYYVNQSVTKENKKALISIPGIGCGQFAGEFQGSIGELLKNALINIIKVKGSEYKNIHTIHYDPYNECINEDYSINNIKLNIRPYCLGKGGPQLSKDNFKHIKEFKKNFNFFSIVAWDHVSWPGNDFYNLQRVTDDGVKAAASNLMSKITGVDGYYISNRYVPIDPYISWTECIHDNKVNNFWGGRLN